MEGLKAHRRKTGWFFALVLASTIFFAHQVPTATAYDFSSTPAFKKSGTSQSGKTVTLDGKHLTIDDVVAVARFGAKVKLSNEARQRSLNAYYLLLEGAREGIPI
ncbi:MAG: hypothetical protein ACRDNG_13040 [Gaiellaceae bacterium]